MKNSLFLLAAGAALASASPLQKLDQFSDSDGKEIRVVQEIPTPNGKAPAPPMEIDDKMKALIEEAVKKELSGGESNTIDIYVPDTTVSPTSSNVPDSSKQTAKPDSLGNPGPKTSDTSRDQGAGTGRQSSGAYLDILNQHRAEMGKTQLSLSSSLQDLACATSQKNTAKTILEHSKNGLAEVIGVGRDFNDVNLNWICENEALLPPGECQRRIKIKANNQSPDPTGHANIVSGDFKQVGCCSAPRTENTVGGPQEVHTCNFQ